MEAHDPNLLEKIRQQFESSPYPRIPPEASPKGDLNSLYVHNFATPFYLRNQQLIDPKQLVILDVGCGTGYTTLTLAEANPGATIVGIDLSEKSIELARQRLQFHGFTTAQFQVLSLDQVASLELQFDYINCDEVLYLMPDLVQTFQTLSAVLKPHGILRGNLHSWYQRQNYFRAQQFFTLLGLMQNNPEEAEINTVLETMRALANGIPLKEQTWNAEAAANRPQEYVLMNYLFQGDNGFTVGELFSVLREANLEFICMVNQRDWDLLKVFQNAQNLPAFWQENLPKLTLEDQLQLFELIAPVHRLLDFWCGQSGQPQLSQLPKSWPIDEWRSVRVALHPQLQTEAIKADLHSAIQQQRLFNLTQHLSAGTAAQTQFSLSPYLAACLLPLWDAPQTFPALVKRALKIRPCDPITLKPLPTQQVSQELRDALTGLEKYLYVLLTR